jgi:hypothetical protein
VPSWLKTASLYASAFAIAAVFATACDPTYGITAFRCDPSEPNCPSKYGSGAYVCCSDDPAAMDLANVEVPALPTYGGGTGIPLFSSVLNNASSTGFCIATSQVPLDAAIGEAGDGAACPKPCNPTWSPEDIGTVCGPNTSCCASAEIEDLDCGFDPELGDGGCWRPVTGGDITGLGGIEVSNWSSSKHATHQDPGGKGCEAFVASQAAAISAAGLEPEVALVGCYRNLTVANQRGFCQGAMDCPLANPAYRDACEQKNDLEGHTGCG